MILLMIETVVLKPQACNRVECLGILLVQGTRMEERLDDAINVLRNHAESQLGLHLGPVGPHGAIYSHTSPPQLDHLVRIHLEYRSRSERSTLFLSRSLTSRDVYTYNCVVLSDESAFCGNGSTTSGFLPWPHAHA